VIPVLETERLRLREWRAGDFEPFAAIYASEADARFIGGVHGRDDAWRRMASFIGHWTLRGYGKWVLEDKSGGAFVGWSGLWNPEGFPEPEIGWVLMPSMRGRGYAREAALRVRAYAYETLGWSTVISLIAIGNAPSAKVAEKLGCVRERTVPFRGSECAIWRHPAARQRHETSNALH